MLGAVPGKAIILFLSFSRTRANRAAPLRFCLFPSSKRPMRCWASRTWTLRSVTRFALASSRRPTSFAVPLRPLAVFAAVAFSTSAASSLSRGCATCPTMFKGRTKELLIRNVFAAAGRQESDAYGLAAHFGGWLHAANPFHKPRPERRSWPPILIADAATLADPAFQCLLYAFLGLEDPARRYVLSTRLRSLPPLASRRAKHYMDAASLRVYDRLRRHVLGGINASVADANRTYWESSRECRLAPPVARDDDDALVERLFATGRAFERKKGDGDPVDAIPDREWDARLFDILENDREIN